MSFIIRMGLPEMEELWNKLQTEYSVVTLIDGGCKKSILIFTAPIYFSGLIAFLL